MNFKEIKEEQSKYAFIEILNKLNDDQIPMERC